MKHLLVQAGKIVLLFINNLTKEMFQHHSFIDIIGLIIIQMHNNNKERKPIKQLRIRKLSLINPISLVR